MKMNNNSRKLKKKNHSPLHYAIEFQSNSKEILEILISKGANVNVKALNS